MRGTVFPRDSAVSNFGFTGEMEDTKTNLITINCPEDKPRNCDLLRRMQDIDFYSSVQYFEWS